MSSERRAWRCPWCQKEYRIPVDADDPAACPECSKADQPEVQKTAPAPPPLPPHLPQSGPSSRGASKAPPAWLSVLVGAAAVVGLCCGGCGIVGLFGRRDQPVAAAKPEAQQKTPAPRDDKPPKPSPAPIPKTPGVGDDVYLEVPGQDLLFVATTKPAFDEMIRLSVARDNVGITRLVTSGQLLLVDARTSARLLEFGFGRRRVRIMQGRHYGADGWVSTEYVHAP